MNSGISFESRQLHRLKLHIKQPLKKKSKNKQLKWQQRYKMKYENIFN